MARADYCSWHTGQAPSPGALAPIADGAISLEQLRDYAIEYDAASREFWPAREFIAWLELEAEPAWEEDRPPARLHHRRTA